MVYACNGFCNTMEFPLATLWNFNLQLSVFLSYNKHVDQIVVTGVQTPNCIRATVWDANSFDYEVIVLTDGTGAKTAEVHNANLIDMENIGIELMTTDELIKSLPVIPKYNLRNKIEFEIERKHINQGRVKGYQAT